MPTLKQRIVMAGIALAVPLVAGFEGLRQKVYIDPVGIPTACYGHTGPEVKVGQTYTMTQCEGLLMEDLLKAKAAVDRCVKVPLTEGQRVAFTSFTYNVGEMAFCTSTMVRKVNAGQLPAACSELDRWVYAKGMKLPGLVKRRAAERASCES